ncbi:aminopeptidase [Anaerovoracaceae bacterium SGI.195]
MATKKGDSIKDLMFQPKSGWLQLKDKEMDEVLKYNEDYKSFLDIAKTERLASTEIMRQAEAAGFVNIEKLVKTGQKLKAGTKILVNNKDKSIGLFIIGKKPLEEGMRLVGAHIDSPRLDFKPNPIYEDGHIALGKTHYYGGVKKYQWTTLPLAIHGVLYKKDGEKVTLAIGDKPEDPVFCVTDLLIHLSKAQMQKTMAEGVTGEMMNVVLGNIPVNDEEEGKAVKLGVLELLKERYGVVEEDFLMAEIEVVPAGNARDLGLDRSMVLAYGQDDRVCAYATLNAILQVKDPEYTACGLFMDKEEIGSYGNTGMDSYFLENTIHELVALEGEHSSLKVRRAMKNSKVLSADVTAAFDPDFPDVMEKQNTCYLGFGVAVSKYGGSGGKGGSNDANAEFLSELRTVFADNDVVWQMGELGKVDAGGGGTIAFLLSRYGMEVVDCGTPVLNMHSPYELSSKVDNYMTMKAYRAFMK